MSDAGRRVFVYPERRATVRGGLLILIYFVGARMLISAIFRPILLALLVPLGLIAWLLTSLFLRQRPIAVTEDGIDALLVGWPWRTIAWRDMDRIEKRIVPEFVDAEGGLLPHIEEIFFRSGKRRIFVTSAITDFAALKRDATERAKQRGVELVQAKPRSFWRPPLLTRLDEL